jgi:hypothetical protein
MAGQIVVSGATGLVGRALLDELASLPSPAPVVALSRSAGGSAARLGRQVSALRWDPTSAEPDAALIAAVDGARAVVHLAGEPAVGVRLTAARKQLIRSSRLASTALLVRAAVRAARPPEVFVCASAVGYYGAQPGERELDEAAGPGRGFLAELCVEWEAAAAEAARLGVRVVSARLGIVLSPAGGALAALARPVRWFVGGPIGDGRQVVSWIHIRDAARALSFALEHAALRGPMNVTAPTACTNAELTAALGRALRRPTLLPVPALALRAAFADGAEPLVTGQRVLPRRLLDAGFTFTAPRLEEALAELLR